MPLKASASATRDYKDRLPLTLLLTGGITVLARDQLSETEIQYDQDRIGRKTASDELASRADRRLGDSWHENRRLLNPCDIWLLISDVAFCIRAPSSALRLRAPRL